MRIPISLLFLASLQGCSDSPRLTPEDHVRNTLVKMEEAAEQRSLAAFMQHVSENYLDNQGNTRDDVRRIIQFQYIANQKIYILSKVQSLEIEGDTARVKLSVAMAGTQSDLAGDTNRLRANTHHFSIVLQATADQENWLVTSALRERGWE
ncbi:MAG: hypothetical protein HKN85_07250 [Gammaproteobacteria bacterium]|nr:hypothetical protein [Gammaproteobacteria bacterium]